MSGLHDIGSGSSFASGASGMGPLRWAGAANEGVSVPLVRTTSANADIGLTANQCHFFPVEFASPFRISRTQAQVSVAGTGAAQIAMCLYNYTGNRRLVWKNEDLAAATTGNKLFDLAGDYNDAMVTPGTYIFGWCSNETAIQLKGWNTGNRLNGTTTVGVGDGSVCPLTPTFTESNWAIPIVPEISFYAN